LVWDYAGDNYVHRLIENSTDGKFIYTIHLNPRIACINLLGKPVEYDGGADNFEVR
jgi:hypothetical protein